MISLTAKEAYNVLCSKYNEKFVVKSCRDYGNLYAFLVAPSGTNTSMGSYTGASFLCVNKLTKKVTIEEIYDLHGRYRFVEDF